MSGQIFTGQDADGNSVSQEYLNLGVTRIGLTVPTPVSEKTSSPNTGWDGTAKMSPQQVRDELVEAFKNGSELYNICNNKLNNAKLEIEKVEKIKKS